MFLAKNWTVIFRIATMLLLAGIWLGQMRADYVTKKDIEAAIAPLAQQARDNSVHIAAMETTIAVMAEQNKRNDRQDEVIKELEARIRAVERAH